MRYEIPITLVAATTVVPRLVKPATSAPAGVVWEASVPVRAAAADRMGGDKSGFARGTRPNGWYAEIPNVEED